MPPETATHVHPTRPDPENPLNAAGEPEYAAPSMQCEATRLMIAVKRGDTKAFDELVKSLRGRAFHVARSLVGSHDDAMELSQETFLKIYRARETFREGEPFLPWFHRILRNTCFSFLREDKRGRTRSISAGRKGDDDETPDMELTSLAPGPLRELEGDERAQAFWKAFRELPARDREMLGMRHFQELSYREIAQALSIPEGTVMSRLFHARRKLRENLRGTALDDFDAEGFNQPRGRGPGAKK